MQLATWEWVLLVGSIYLAVLSLVGLIRRKRSELVAELTAQAEAEQIRQEQAEKQRVKDERKRKAVATNEKRRAA